MDDRSTVMPEEIALLDRAVTDPVWAGRLAADDDVADLGATFVVNSLVTPTRLASTSLIAAQSVAAAGDRISQVTLRRSDELLISTRSGNPSAPAYWEVPALADAVGLELGMLPALYSSWRFCVEIYVVRGGAAYLLLDDMAMRHRVLSADEVSLTLVQRLVPFMEATPAELTGTMVFLVCVPGRMAALGGLRGYRRALIESGVAAQCMAGIVRPREDVTWRWDTEFYDDVAARVLGVDGVERIITHIGHETTVTDPPNSTQDAE